MKHGVEGNTQRCCKYRRCSTSTNTNTQN